MTPSHAVLRTLAALLLVALPAMGQLFPGLSQCRRNVPDPSIAVGHYFVVQTTNSRIRVTSKSGQFVWFNSLDAPAIGGCSGTTYLNTLGFFEQLGATRIADTKVLYDQYEGRYLVVGLQIDSPSAPPGTPGIYIAYSNDEYPLPQLCGGGWKKFHTPGTFQVGGLTYRADYTGLGVTPTYVIYSGVLQPVGGTGPTGGHILRYVKKTDLKSGVTPLPYVDVLPTTPRPIVEVPQVAHCFDVSAHMLLVGIVGTGSGSALRLSVINPANGTAIETTVPVPNFVLPTGGAPQAGSSGNTLDALDGRIMNAVYRGGFLYTCHTVVGNGKLVARWYQIALNAWPIGVPTLVQSGDVDLGANATGSPIHTFYPAIAVDSFDNVGLVFARSALDEFASVWRSGRFKCDPPGTLRPAMAIAGGNATFTASGPTGLQRWGDYFDIAVDPLTVGTFWGTGEIAMPGSSSGAGCPTGFAPDHWETRIGAWSILANPVNGSFANYGWGWPGTNGIPAITLDRIPRIGETPYIVVDNSSGIAGALAGLNIGPLAAAPPGQATPFGGVSWVDLATATSLSFNLNDPLQEYVALPIPCDPGLAGLSFFLQMLEIDAGASHGISFTPGLSMVVGH